MSSFPILNLPLIPIQKVISFLPPGALVHLALTSKRLKTIIGLTNLFVDYFRISITNFTCRIEMKLFYNECKFIWIFRERAPPIRPHATLFREFKSSYVPNPLRNMKIAVEWISKMIRFPVGIVTIRGSMYDGIEDILRWEPIHQCEQLEVRNVDFSNVEEAAQPDFKLFKDLEILTISNGGWLEVDHLAQLLETENIQTQITDCSFTWERVNEFVKIWMESGNTKLRRLWIQFESNDEENGNRRMLFEGLEIRPRDPEMRPKNYPRYPHFPAVFCEHAQDIIRQDGALASLVPSRNCFHFVVWHPEDSNRQRS